MRHGESLSERDEFKAFYREIIRRHAERQAWRAWVLKIDDRPMATIFGLLYEGTLYAEKTTYVAGVDKASPGSGVIRHAIEQSFREGLARDRSRSANPLHQSLADPYTSAPPCGSVQFFGLFANLIGPETAGASVEGPARDGSGIVTLKVQAAPVLFGETWSSVAMGMPPVLLDRAISLQFSASNALWQGLRQLGLKPGDRVLFPAYHCGAELDVCVKAELNIAFDVDPSLSIDWTALHRLVDAGRALFVIHYFGFPVELEPARGAGNMGWP
ncbi:MAG: GNAT family N-acetyltransferase [Nitrospiraceae bacterium]